MCFGGGGQQQNYTPPPPPKDTPAPPGSDTFQRFQDIRAGLLSPATQIGDVATNRLGETQAKGTNVAGAYT